MEPQFTVVIPTRNRLVEVRAAIGSVLDQHDATFELIVVDDGSTDGTDRWLAGQDDPRLRWIRQENRGRSEARNAGARLARGRWVTFLDSDDTALTGWLAGLGAGASDAQVAVVCCGIEVRSAGHPPRVELPKDMRPVFPVAAGLFRAGTFAVRRDLWEQAGGYARDLAFSENTELAYRLLEACERRGYGVAAVMRPLVAYHRTPAPMDANAMRDRYRSACHMLSHHQDRLSRSRRALATYARVAGTAAARIGEFRSARSHLWTSLRAYPWQPRELLLVVTTLIPGVRRALLVGDGR